MIETRKHLLIGSALLLGALALIGGCWGYLDDARSRALAASDKLAECKSLALEIKQLRGGALATASEPARQLEIRRRISRAVSASGLPDVSVKRIETDRPRDAAAGPFIEKPTRILLGEISLRQAITLLQVLDRPADGLRIGRVHLTAPQDSADSKTWTGEFTLLHTLPKPQADSSRTNDRAQSD